MAVPYKSPENENEDRDDVSECVEKVDTEDEPEPYIPNSMQQGLKTKAKEMRDGKTAELTFHKAIPPDALGLPARTEFVWIMKFKYDADLKDAIKFGLKRTREALNPSGQVYGFFPEGKFWWCRDDMLLHFIQNELEDKYAVEISNDPPEAVVIEPKATQPELPNMGAPNDGMQSALLTELKGIRVALEKLVKLAESSDDLPF